MHRSVNSKGNSVERLAREIRRGEPPRDMYIPRLKTQRRFYQKKILGVIVDVTTMQDMIRQNPKTGEPRSKTYSYKGRR